MTTERKDYTDVTIFFKRKWRLENSSVEVNLRLDKTIYGVGKYLGIDSESVKEIIQRANSKLEQLKFTGKVIVDSHARQIVSAKYLIAIHDAVNNNLQGALA